MILRSIMGYDEFLPERSKPKRSAPIQLPEISGRYDAALELEPQAWVVSVRLPTHRWDPLEC